MEDCPLGSLTTPCPRSVRSLNLISISDSYLSSEELGEAPVQAFPGKIKEHNNGIPTPEEWLNRHKLDTDQTNATRGSSGINKFSK